MWIAFSLLVALIGVLIYALTSANAKVVEIGRIMFWTGLLAFLLQVSNAHFALTSGR
jgi:hypothetical protein